MVLRNSGSNRVYNRKRTEYRVEKDQTEKLVLAVEAISVSAQKPFHAGHEVGFGRFDDQMKVIGHQTIGVDLPIGFGTSLAEGVEEEEAIGVVAEDGFPSVTAVHDVVDRPFIFQAEFARHEPGLHPANKYVNEEPTPSQTTHFP